MESSYKTFNCKIHGSEPVQRVCTENDGESPLRCIECILYASVASSKKSIITLNEFIELAAKFYEGVRNMSSLEDSAPFELVEFLVDEHDVLQKLTKHFEEQKDKVTEAINNLLQEFTLLCYQKKEKLFENLEKQHDTMKANYAYYQSKVDKYFNKSTKSQHPTKDQIIEKINICSNIDDLDTLIKQIKDDMNEASTFQNSNSKIAEIKASMKELSLIMQDYSKNFPFVPMASDIQSDATVKKFKDLINPFLDQKLDIEKAFEEISLSTSNFDSKIITKQNERTLLKNWVKKNGIVRFKLLYRGSRDGYASDVFHAKCDNIANTLTVVRAKNTMKVFGGFSDQTWNSTSNYKNTAKSWLFSMTHQEKIPCKANCANYGTYAISTYLPTWGGGHDLCLVSNGDNLNTNYSNLGHSYDHPNDQNKLAGSYNFQIDEIEVFSVDTKVGDTQFESSLIKKDDLTLLKGWVAAGKNPSFELIYQASKDGFGSANFHTACDNQGATLVVCKSTTGKLFGGYTSKPWNQSEDFTYDNLAFLFSLTNKKKLNILSGDCAIFGSAETGPVFGAGYDLFVCANSNILEESNSNLGITYNNSGVSGNPGTYLAGSNKFLLDEIEVFKVTV